MFILIVDHSKVNLKLAERLVGKMGCAAVSAANEEIAVSMFRSDLTMKVVLMDKQMPICEVFKLHGRYEKSSNEKEGGEYAHCRLDSSSDERRSNVVPTLWL